MPEYALIMLQYDSTTRLLTKIKVTAYNKFGENIAPCSGPTC